MKFKLMVAAIATSMATTAMADVNVSGKVRTFMESYEAGTAAALTRVTGDTSRIKFSGGEALDNGMGVFFNIETGIDSDEPGATTLGNREMVVGLSSGDSSVSLGRAKHSIARTMDQFGDIGHALGNIADSVHDGQGTRFDNGAYASTSVGPIKASVEYGFSETAGTDDTVAYSVAGTLAGADVKYAKYDATGDTTDMIGASVKLGDATTLKGLWSDTNGAIARSAGIDQKLNDRLTAQLGYGQKGSADGYAGGLTYSFSKSTMVHARYSDFTGATSADDVKRIAVGIEYNF